MSKPDASQRQTENYILSSLPLEEYERLRPHLTPVSLERGQVLYEPEGEIEYVYFPETSVISLSLIMEDGETAEVGAVGRRGMAGVRVFFGAHTTPYLGIVTVAGGAARMPSRVLREECRACNALQDELLRYTLALVTELRQLVACNRLHPLPSRVARWLLLTSDRAHSDELAFTHEEISDRLGMRRSGVTTTMQELKDAGAIEYGRGQMRIIDRERLEAHTCECYREISRAYDGLYGAQSAR